MGLKVGFLAVFGELIKTFWLLILTLHSGDIFTMTYKRLIANLVWRKMNKYSVRKNYLNGRSTKIDWSRLDVTGERLEPTGG
ncbi:hypothetical protein [Marinoscillum sp.]|uniref:hypothetical protein n=1 Tax=Marinoscillum sp. TaxID=2024838 RepID=UPI003BAA2FF6